MRLLFMLKRVQTGNSLCMWALTPVTPLKRKSSGTRTYGLLDYPSYMYIAYAVFVSCFCREKDVFSAR